MDAVKRFYELVSNIGENDLPNMHIIDITDDMEKAKGDRNFRIYHKDGYCVEIHKYINTEDFAYRKVFYYYFSDLHEGFKDIDIYSMYNLLTPYEK